MEFVQSAAGRGLSYAAPIVIGSLKYSAKQVPKIIRPAADFGRAALGGTARIEKLNEYGATTQTIGVFTRAGMQTNKAIRVSTYAVATKAPSLAVRAVKFGTRIAVKDAIITPYYATAHRVYIMLTAGRHFRGASTAIERYANSAVMGVNSRLARVGLAPTLRGDLASYARIITYGAIYDRIRSTAGGKSAIDAYAAAVADQYAGVRNRVHNWVDSVLPATVPAPVIVGTAPVVAPPVPTPVVVPVPTRTSEQSRPVYPPPPYNPRRR